VSVTVAVHVVVPLTGTVAGAQLTLVPVDRTVAVMLVLPLLPVWTLSPADAAVIVCGPIADGVYVTEHCPLALSVHAPLPLNVPLSVVNVTPPVGVVPPAPAVSVTVAAHVVVPLTGTVVGAQLTLVLVDRAIAVMLVLPLLPAWTLSPADAAVIVCGPIADGVYVTEHCPLALSVHAPLPLNVPLSVVNVTPPVGVVPPAPAVSVTVAVHVVVPFTATVVGVQLTLVPVDRTVAVMLVLPLLPVWTLSPADAAVIVWGPIADGVYVTEHCPLALSVQAALPLNVPLSVVNVTPPVGVVAPAPAVSVTVAVQVVAPLTGVVVGVQLTLVLVDRAVALAVTPLLPVLVAWELSPAYDAAMVCGPATVGV
jgi:hypothetical protein